MMTDLPAVIQNPFVQPYSSPQREQENFGPRITGFLKPCFASCVLCPGWLVSYHFLCLLLSKAISRSIRVADSSHCYMDMEMTRASNFDSSSS